MTDPHRIPRKAQISACGVGFQPGGSSVMIQVEGAGSAAVAKNMIAGKVEIVILIKDRPCGTREGRIRDPFGRHWVLSQEVA